MRPNKGCGLKASVPARYPKWIGANRPQSAYDFAVTDGPISRPFLRSRDKSARPQIAVRRLCA